MVSTFVRLRNGCDNVLAYLKWPAAALAVLLLPASVRASFDLITTLLGEPGPFIPFVLGAAGWLVIWWNLMRRAKFTFFLTLEHEMTHAIFAWLTFHRVTGMRVTLGRGGQMSFVGKGNWLITISPYFFPTASVFLILVFAFAPSQTHKICSFLLGATFAWNITSTMRETHGGQTDLQKVGKVFAFLFLPTANLVSLGSVLSYAYGGLTSWSAYIMQIIRSFGS